MKAAGARRAPSPGAAGGGITRVVSIGALACTAAAAAAGRAGLPAPVLYATAYTACVGWCVAVCTSRSVNYTGLFGKDPRTGRLPLARRAAFAPYLWMVRQWALKKRAWRLEDRYNVIVEGPEGRASLAGAGATAPLAGPRRVYLGCWPEGGRRHLPVDASPAGAALAVVDVTCELQRTHQRLEYLCLPTWDTRGPDAGQMAEGLRWAERAMGDGNDLYVHCAHGHGRSAAFVSALIVHMGLAPDVAAAAAHLKRRRPRVKMNAEQTRAAEECLAILRGAGR